MGASHQERRLGKPSRSHSPVSAENGGGETRKKYLGTREEEKEVQKQSLAGDKIMKKIKIDVTEADIKNGIRFLSKKCPVALAVKRILKKPVQVWGDTYNLVIQKGKENEIRLPGKVDTFVERFDKGEKVKPFSFFLPVAEVQKGSA